MGSVDYKEVGDWGDGVAVRKAIVVRPQDCTRERLVELANHLAWSMPTWLNNASSPMPPTSCGRP